jgi:valyl-tRNA synthetase
LLHDVHLRRIRYRHGSKLYSVVPNFKNEVNEKYFEFQRLESSIYSWWESSGYFKPDESNSDEAIAKTKKKKKPFVIPMPPPNVTGYLHMGHAIFVALQDIMARFHRMRGRPTLWLPGT